MSISVTLRQGNTVLRKPYKTLSRALASVHKWLGKNEGVAIVYAPGQLPAVYESQCQLSVTTGKTTTNFYQTAAWRQVRVNILQQADFSCSYCGRGGADGCVLHVDHIKPRSKYPQLALEPSNLQVLCEDCNLGKSDRDDIGN